MRKLTKKEWLKARWWAILLYLGMTITVTVFCLKGFNNPTISLGELWLRRILPLIIIGASIFFIVNDSCLVGKCLKCGKTLIVLNDTCPHCGSTFSITNR